MITVHHLENSQSFRIVWLLEELGMEYELKTYKRNDDLMAPENFKNIAPLGTSPTITVGDLALSESNAIIDYILDKAGNSTLRPSPSAPNRTDYLFWFHTAQGSLMPIMSVDGVWRITCTKVPCPIRPLINSVYKAVQKGYVKPRLEKIYGLAEQQLTNTSYFAGNDLTAADVTLIYPMESSLLRYPELAEKYPGCKAWLDRVQQREQFQAALKKVGEKTVSAEL